MYLPLAGKPARAQAGLGLGPGQPALDLLFTNSVPGMPGVGLLGCAWAGLTWAWDAPVP